MYTGTRYENYADYIKWPPLPPQPRKHYYYTRWHLSENDGFGLKSGIYHTTWITTSTFKEMLRDTLPTKEFFIKEFRSEEEMREFAKTVGL